MKLLGNKMGIKFDGKPLVVEQNNYTTKIVNAYIIYECIYIKTSLFGAISIVKYSDKAKWLILAIA